VAVHAPGLLRPQPAPAHVVVDERHAQLVVRQREALHRDGGPPVERPADLRRGQRVGEPRQRVERPGRAGGECLVEHLVDVGRHGLQDDRGPQPARREQPVQLAHRRRLRAGLVGDDGRPRRPGRPGQAPLVEAGLGPGRLQQRSHVHACSLAHQVATVTGRRQRCGRGLGGDRVRPGSVRLRDSSRHPRQGPDDTSPAPAGRRWPTEPAAGCRDPCALRSPSRLRDTCRRSATGSGRHASAPRWAPMADRARGRLERTLRAQGPSRLRDTCRPSATGSPHHSPPLG
jgi:hypothetical protein